ncbi:hypothetical protein JQN72_03350 [Phycicoccus sp. CSK15P-2]|uniref:sensor histidine kinase n=1 Tax=Phycicoccus sp. CSK15P-2 TaxID=2807627 RepID=UPI00194F6328|nr:histidine kinase [Phycicoccus sp. CSK15P-2]MBM6403282.1 hypothetical protein [Phycicoccus sp. CSK15P-2]
MERLRGLMRRAPAVDLAVWVTVALPVVLASEPLPEDSAVSAGTFRVGALVLLAAAVPLARRAPLAAALLPAAYALVLTGQLYSEELLLAEPVFAFLLGRRTTGSRAAVQLAGFLVLVALLHAVAVGGGSVEGWLELAGSLLLQAALPWTAGQYVRQYAELLRSGWELAERLDHEREVVAEQVRLRERARIAADMHDSLGHELSLIAVRAAALEVSSDVGARGHRSAGELRRAAAAATERMRDIVGVLREDDGQPSVLPADDSVAALVRRAAESGMPVVLDDAPSRPPVAVPEAGRRAAYRVVQEALTNAARHAPGAPVTVTQRLDETRGHLTVTVVNGVPPRKAPPTRALGSMGHGLIGIDERVRLAGGTMTATPVTGGFAVRARIPVTPRPAPAPAAAPLPAREARTAARRQLQRGVLAAFWAPLALGLVLVVMRAVDPGQP